MDASDRGDRETVWVLPSKLARPRLGRPAVPRPRVWDLLDEAVDAPASIVAAPAGYGKTVAVATWLQARPRPAAWLSLDAGDNERARLWAHVLAAVARQWPAAGAIPAPLGGVRDTLRRLAEVLAAGSGDPRAAGSGAGAGSGEPRGVLVLDDVHRLTDPARLTSLRDAIEILGPHVHVMLLTRDAGRLGLAASGRARVVTIDRAQLAFTPAEARRLLLGVERLPLAPGQVDGLTRRARGWGAALRLAALWLADQDDPGEALQRFSGTHRWLVDYLATAVLDDLDPRLVEFLVRSSSLPRLSGELCDHTLQRTDSAETLAGLRSAGLFVSLLDEDGTWYAYHDLFREALQMRLRREPEALRAQLAARAGAWFADHGFVEDAIEQAWAVSDHERVAALLLAHHLELSREGRSASLARWMSGLPEPVVEAHPGLLAVDMIAISAVSDREHRVRVLNRARAARERDPDVWTPYQEAALCLLSGQDRDDDLDAALEHARRAVEIAQAHGIDLVVPALAGLAFVHFLRGEEGPARERARAAREQSRSAARPFGYATATATLALLADTDADAGDPDADGEGDGGLRELADEAMRSARDAGILDTWTGARVRMADARAALHAGELDRAREDVTTALRHTPRDSTAARAWMLATLAEVALRAGDPRRAQRLLARAQPLTRAPSSPRRCAPGRRTGRRPS